MKRFLVLGVGLFLTFQLNGQSRQERDVLALSKAKFRWLVEKNYDSLNSVLDDRLTYIHSNGWVQTKHELIADLKSAKLTYDNIQITEARVRMYPKSAVVTGKGKFTASLNGTSATYDLAFSETYVLQKREWKLASRHASRAQ